MPHMSTLLAAALCLAGQNPGPDLPPARQELLPLPRVEQPPAGQSPPAQPPQVQESIIAVRPTQAYPHLPVVQPVPAPGDSDPSRYNGELSQGLQPLEDYQAGPHGSKLPLVNYRFPCAAHFPLPRFGALPYEDLFVEGAVIYEGMQFVANEQGYYEVRFTVSVPSTPATLRLQLLLADARHEPFCLTLPPIALAPPDDVRVGNFQGASYQIRHIGFSPRLAGLSFPPTMVERRGAARFGTLPPPQR